MSSREEIPARPARRPKAWAPRLLAFAWIILGVLALGHMFGLQTYFEPAKTLTARYEGPAEIHTTDPVLRNLQGTIARLTETTAALNERTAALDTKIAALETALGPPTAAIGPAAVRSAQPARPPVAKAAPPVSIGYRPLPSSGFGDNDQAASPLPIASGASTQTAFGIELARSPTPEPLSETWSTVFSRESKTLAGLEPRRASSVLPSGQRRWSLLAGPFSNAADAARVCARLQAEKLFCREAVFAGEPLPEDGQPVP